MSTTAGPALVDALTADVDRLRAAEPDVRQDIPDSVHKMRVATRRLRSLLKSYRQVLRRRQVSEVSDELRWLAGLLGVARDAEVRADRFEALLGENGALLDPEAAQGKKSGGAKKSAAKKATAQRKKATPRDDFGTRLIAEERARYTAALKEAIAAFDDDRYQQLLTRLATLLSDTPLRRKLADEPADEIFAEVLHRDFRDLRHLVHTEPDSGAPEAERIEHLHDIRKAAKRLRYSAEAAVEVLGDPADRLSRHAKSLQTVLGDHRDAIEALDTLHAHAEAANETAYQRLCAAEEAAAAKALEDYPTAIEFLSHHAL